MPENVADHVDSWPYEKYPMKGPDGKPVSNWWKLTVLEYDGRQSFHYWKGQVKKDDGTVEEQTKQLQPKQYLVTSLGDMPRKDDDPEESSGLKMTSKIPSIEIVKAEQKIGGKPTLVQMGVWGKWDGEKWVMDDRKKVPMPRYWRDMTEEYYGKEHYHNGWREQAYKETGEEDLFANAKRPYTQYQQAIRTEEKLLQELKEKENLIEQQNAELKRLNEKGNK